LHKPTPNERADAAVEVTNKRDDLFAEPVADVYVCGVLVGDGLPLALAEQRAGALRSALKLFAEAEAPGPNPKRWAPRWAVVPEGARD
jgi:hypothetical protein